MRNLKRALYTVILALCGAVLAVLFVIDTINMSKR